MLLVAGLLVVLQTFLQEVNLVGGFFLLTVLTESYSLLFLRARVTMMTFPVLYRTYVFLFGIYFYVYPFGFTYLAFSSVVCLSEHAMLFFWNNFDLPSLLRNRINSMHFRECGFQSLFTVLSMNRTGNNAPAAGAATAERESPLVGMRRLINQVNEIMDRMDARRGGGRVNAPLLPPLPSEGLGGNLPPTLRHRFTYTSEVNSIREALSVLEGVYGHVPTGRRVQNPVGVEGGVGQTSQMAPLNRFLAAEDSDTEDDHLHRD